MSALFTRLRGVPLYVLGLVLLVLFAVQLLFLAVESVNANRDARLVRALLNKESHIINPYQLSRTLGNLDLAGFINCVKVNDMDTGQAFLDMPQSSECHTDNHFLLDGQTKSLTLTSANGKAWQVLFRSQGGDLFSYSLWAIRVFSVLFSIYLFVVLHRRWRRIELVKEIERTQKEKALTLASQTAHDLASPFTALQVLSKKESLSKDEIDLMQKAIMRSFAIVQKLKKDAKQQDEKPQMSGIDLKSLCQSIAKEKEVERDVKITIQIDDSAQPLVPGDKGELARVISNLLNNGIEACCTKPKILLRLGTAKGQPYLRVEDNGSGISDPTLKRLGQRGFTTKPTGSGLGLAHAYSYMRKFGGTIEVDSSVGVGTTISLIWPSRPHLKKSSVFSQVST